MTEYISEFQKPSRWKYLREKHFASALTRNAIDYGIDSSLLMHNMFLSITEV